MSPAFLSSNTQLQNVYLLKIMLFSYLAMGHNLWLHFGVDEHPVATYFDVHQGYRVLTCFQGDRFH